MFFPSKYYRPCALKCILAVLFLMPVLCCCQSVKRISGDPCLSKSTSESQQIVDDCACAFREFRLQTDAQTIDYLVSEAKGVFILPAQYKVAFMIGVKGGTGVLCAKDDTGFWNGPAFYSLGGADIGVQAGISGSTILIFFFDNESLEKVYSGTFNLSVGADLVLGDVSDSKFRDTLSASGNVLTLVNSNGFLGSMAYSGGVFTPRHKLNRQYFGRDITVNEILSEHKYDLPKADILFNELLGI